MATITIRVQPETRRRLVHRLGAIDFDTHNAASQVLRTLLNH